MRLSSELVWRQNLKARIRGIIPYDERWNEIFIEQIDRDAALIAALTEALEPFADVIDQYDPEDESDETPGTLVIGSATDYSLTLGDFRRASAALSLAKSETPQ